MNWLRKHKTLILTVVVAGFIISSFIGFGRYFSSGGGMLDTVAEINDDQIPYRHFTTLYNRLVNSRRDKGEELTPEVLNQMKQEVMQSLIQESVFYQESKRYGIQVSDTELAQSLASIPAFQKEGKFDWQAYNQALQFGLHTSKEEFEESQRKQIAISRLRAFVLQGIKISDAEVEQDYLQARAAQKQSVASASKNSPKDFEKEKDQFREKLRQEKAAQILNRWYQQLGTNLRVKIHLDEIERRGR